MRSKRSLLFILSAMALILSCSASGAREGSASAAGSDPAPAAQAKQVYRDEMKLDFTGLDAAAKERAVKILNAQKCPCGCSFESIAECLVKDPKCPVSPGLARTVLDAVRSGKNDAQVVAALNPAAGPSQPAPVVQIGMEGVVTKGKASAKVTLVEYADFQCPYCVRAVPMVNQLLAQYPDDLKFAFKQLPLVSIHPFAMPAARASMAAGRQGRFWEMYDKLFANARALDDASLKKYASEIGLDAARFEKDFNDPAVVEAINRDVAESQRIGVQGTPTFFVNGVQVPSSDPSTMSRMIEAARSGGDVAAIAGEVRQRIMQQEQQRRQAQLAQQAAEAARVLDIDVAGSPVKGDPKAPVTIVEFADFQCPYCANSVPLLKQVLEAYPGKVKFVFKHLPLNMHANAEPAALAAIEAMNQGKFWEMHDLLFQNYQQLSAENLKAYAKQVGLDMQRFEAATTAKSNKPKLDKDVADSAKHGIHSTPSFYVNGRRVMQRDFATFKRMIDEALASSSPRASS